MARSIKRRRVLAEEGATEGLRVMEREAEEVEREREEIRSEGKEGCRWKSMENQDQWMKGRS